MKINRYRGKAFRVFIPEGFNVLEDNIYDEIRQRFFLHGKVTKTRSGLVR